MVDTLIDLITKWLKAKFSEDLTYEHYFFLFLFFSSLYLCGQIIAPTLFNHNAEPNITQLMATMEDSLPTAQAIVGIIPPATAPIFRKDTVEVPVNTVRANFTNSHYSGFVIITIRGEGSIDENTAHDAFFSYTQGGNPEPFDGFAIKIMGAGSSAELSRPAFADNHEYRLLYFAGDVPRRVGFQMVNKNQADTAVFTVEIAGQSE
ncbi:MAG: hypothetical protein H6672_10465 [Anaerolineaceae bacterium]|nr:hypothetical protein [Anaerolineaceae bacterium]